MVVKSGWFSCDYSAKELMADRIKLISPIFKKVGIPVTITPVYNQYQHVSATAKVNTTTATTTPTSWNVTRQPVKRKLVDGKPVGKPVPTGKATTTISATKPKTGASF
ncbi:MAG: hypothetical protein IPJ81_08725 [Chitinophagaceae bacterium]|nr:hypothetical protein [Chitinophagaceae bacterium]